MTRVKKGTTGVYCITNTVTDKAYVGSSSDIGQRWSTHKWRLRKNVHPNEHLQRAWNKSGEHAFVFEILETCSVDVILEREQYWIIRRRGHENGYNLKANAEGMRGFKHSDTTKQKQSEAMKKHAASPDWPGRKNLKQYA